MTKQEYIERIQQNIRQLEQQVQKEKERLVDLEGMKYISVSDLYTQLSKIQKAEIEETKTIIVIVPEHWLLFGEQLKIISQWAKDTSNFSRYDDPTVSIKYTKI